MTGKRFLVVAVVALICLAIVGGAASAVSSDPSSQDQPAPALPRGYRLTSVSWEVDGTLSGPGYRLPASAAGTGTPCCCNYLPCIRRPAP